MKYIKETSELQQVNIEMRINDLFVTYDILVLEDLEKVISHTTLQHFLYKLLEYWKKQKKKVFVTSTVRLQKLTWVTEELKQYFEDAIEEELKRPKYHDKIAFLKTEIYKNVELGYHFGPDVIKYIALNYGDNYEKLKHSIQKILTVYQRGLWGNEIDVEIIKDILEGILN